MSSNVSEQSFYDELTEDYDEMTSYSTRWKSVTGFVEKILEHYKLNKSVDIACGTGIYSIALAQAGVKMCGIDISPSMIRAAEKNADKSGVSELTYWKVGAMQNNLNWLPTDHDACLCMANSLPHVLTEKDLKATLNNFYDIVKPGGTLIVQLLNYFKIMQRQERIVSVDKGDDKEFVRFYDFLDKDYLRFNVLRINWNETRSADYDLQSICLKPYTYKYLDSVLAKHGFTDLQFFGSPAFDDFQPDESDTLCIIARKLQETE